MDRQLSSTPNVSPERGNDGAAADPEYEKMVKTIQRGRNNDPVEGDLKVNVFHFFSSSSDSGCSICDAKDCRHEEGMPRLVNAPLAVQEQMGGLSSCEYSICADAAASEKKTVAINKQVPEQMETSGSFKPTSVAPADQNNPNNPENVPETLEKEDKPDGLTLELQHSGTEDTRVTNKSCCVII
ncbi:uncharacterized protein LOC125765882 [Anopheles funestus]|uniref:uncharacterized protein LOC125765882 n=1 Tax=Anopheles funestus TaxID=62324 RepID=UPI0020C5C84B|nr:uncharacterized protein LOC125765882 [Anopheles funestus]